MQNIPGAPLMDGPPPPEQTAYSSSFKAYLIFGNGYSSLGAQSDKQGGTSSSVLSLLVRNSASPVFAHGPSPNQPLVTTLEVGLQHGSERPQDLSISTNPLPKQHLLRPPPLNTPILMSLFNPVSSLPGTPGWLSPLSALWLRSRS